MAGGGRAGMEVSNVARVGQHALSLRFERQVEREYQRYYVSRNVAYSRVAFALGIVLYALFAYLDYVLSPGSYPLLWTVRLGVMTPLLLALLAFTSTRQYRRLMQPTLAVVGVLTCLSVDVINVIAYEDTAHAYYFGVIITNLYMHTFGRVQWAWAAPVGLLNAALYDASLLFADGVTFQQVVVANYFVVSTTVLGMVASYTMEHMSRREFLHHRELTHANAELHEHSRTDPLTGLPNRRSMQERLAGQAVRAALSGRGFVVALIDVDHFKRINDVHGHEAGDVVLCRLGSAMREFLRASDAVARWGGEEFIVLLPETDATGASAVCERLRMRVGELRVAHAGATIRVTVTLGLAEVLPGEAVEHALRRADLALYEGKRRGRDRVVVADDAVASAVARGDVASPARIV